MKRLYRLGMREYKKRILLIFIFCIIWVILMLLTAGQPVRNLAQSTPIVITQSVTPALTQVTSPPPAEAEITNGLILAGALLILVIITGTLYATWGLRIPLRERK